MNNKIELNSLFEPPTSDFIEISNLTLSYESFRERMLLKEKENKEFIYIASHDLQEPLRIINSYSKIMEIEYEDLLDEDGKKYFSYIRLASLRMKNLLVDLLSYSKVSENQLNITTFSVKELVEEIKEGLIIAISESHATITCRGDVFLTADRTLCYQLFQNLITNSIKYNKKSPEINLELNNGGNYEN